MGTCISTPTQAADLKLMTVWWADDAPCLSMPCISIRGKIEGLILQAIFAPGFAILVDGA